VLLIVVVALATWVLPARRHQRRLAYGKPYYQGLTSRMSSGIDIRFRAI